MTTILHAIGNTPLVELRRNYEEGAYSRLIDYREELAIPLAADDAAWADGLLREKGLRPTA